MASPRVTFAYGIGAILLATGLVGCNSGGDSRSGSQSPPSKESAFPLRVGDVGPIASDNPRQQPFTCLTQKTVLGRPIVDNHDGIGDGVVDENDNVIGYSEDCDAEMKVEYLYRSTSDEPGDELRKYNVDNPPNNVKTFSMSGKDVPIIVRHEIGVINRFIYSIYMLSPSPDKGQRDLGIPDKSEWNGDLIYYFTGGTGIGHIQSYDGYTLDWIRNPGGADEAGPVVPLLKNGYAVAMSTGTSTHTTYNLKLTGETAQMVKQQFVAAYGKPKNTFGLGDSGGSIQQFVYAQNHPDLLDALIPVQVFPDMITELTTATECMPLEYYFDKTDARVNGTGQVNPKWKKWTSRQLIIGYHGVDLKPGDPFFSDFKDDDLINAVSSAAGHAGSDACMDVWLGVIPQYVNPRWFDRGDGDQYYYDQSVWDRTPMDYFDDLSSIFGHIPHTNLAPHTYDNVGVQYGLLALKNGKINKKEFLDLNAHIGGLVRQQDMVEPGWPFKGNPESGDNVDPWSARNGTAQRHLDPSDVAPRSDANIKALKAAHRAGLVFEGNIDLPIILIQPYLEAELNQHASQEAFMVRQRLIEAKGDAKNLAIWMTGSNSNDVIGPLVLKALKQETQWLHDKQKPNSVKNACYKSNGDLIAERNGVFNGEVSKDGSKILGGMRRAANAGVCTQRYPIYSDPRSEAGQPLGRPILKCALKPVNAAIEDGTYNDISFTAAQQSRLAQIFSKGVCDYSKPGQGWPPGRSKASQVSARK